YKSFHLVSLGLGFCTKITTKHTIEGDYPILQGLKFTAAYVRKSPILATSTKDPLFHKNKLVTSMHKSCFSFGSMTRATKLPTVPEAVGNHKEDEFDSYPGIAEYFDRHRSSRQRQKAAEINNLFPPASAAPGRNAKIYADF
ncbi:MAG: hypothetical protein JW963_00725, partial [Anaerolineales bacterium]|nr:hypothetical protein [Anaerolineales bacterium]